MRDRVKRLGTPCIAYIFLRSNIREFQSSTGARARIATRATGARAERDGDTAWNGERDGASRILLNARLPRERRRQRPRRTPPRGAKAGALLLVAEARPRAWRVRTSCRARRRDFIHDPSIPFFSFHSGLCVLDVFLSRPFSRRLLRARVSKDSRRRAGPPER